MRLVPVTARILMIVLCLAVLLQAVTAADGSEPGRLGQGSGAPAATEPVRLQQRQVDAAQGQNALRITLEEVLARAQQRSLRVAELQARVDVAAAVVTGRKAADRPVVSLLGGYTRTNHVDEFSLVLPNQPVHVLYPDVPDNSRARLDLQ